MSRIINLTNHMATKEQVEAGVVEAAQSAAVERLLTFESCPTRASIVARARSLAEIARDENAQAAMIGGAPYLMAPLEAALRAQGIAPVYAYSTRVSEEQHQPDGSVRKTQVFKHAGWVWA